MSIFKILNIHIIKCNNINMSTEISFDENQYKIKSRSILGASQVPAMTKFLLNKHIVKTEKSAHALLLGLTGIFFLAAVYVFAVFVFEVEIGDEAPKLTPEQLQIIQEKKERLQKIKIQNQNNINNTQSLQ